MASAIEVAARAFVAMREKHHIFSQQTDGAYQALAAAITEADKDADINEAYRAAAREEWAEDGLEIDDDAVVSIGHGGAMVAAWVFVGSEDAAVEETEL